MTPRPARSRGALVLLLVAIGGAAAAGWALLGTTGTDEASVPETAPPPKETSSPSPRAPAVRPPGSDHPRPGLPPSEAIYAADEDLSAASTPERFVESPIAIESPARDDDHAVRESGERLRTAFLAVPGLLVRWQSDDAKRRFLESRFRLPPDVAPTEGVRGAPLMVVAQMLDESEDFAVSLRPPVLRIGFEGWAPR